MDLIQMTKTVKNKEKNRDKLLGQKEMIIESLKKLGYSFAEAKQASAKLTTELIKMNTHYCNGEEKFKKKFEHLLM